MPRNQSKPREIPFWWKKPNRYYLFLMLLGPFCLSFSELVIDEQPLLGYIGLFTAAAVFLVGAHLLKRNRPGPDSKEVRNDLSFEVHEAPFLKYVENPPWSELEIFESLFFYADHQLIAQPTCTGFNISGTHLGHTLSVTSFSTVDRTGPTYELLHEGFLWVSDLPVSIKGQLVVGAASWIRSRSRSARVQQWMEEKEGVPVGQHFLDRYLDDRYDLYSTLAGEAVAEILDAWLNNFLRKADREQWPQFVVHVQHEQVAVFFPYRHTAHDPEKMPSNLSKKFPNRLPSARIPASQPESIYTNWASHWTYCVELLPTIKPPEAVSPPRE